MEFLSESQLQLISNFRERVRQSEQRMKDTLNTSIPRTPESLPYIHTHGDVSKLSEAQYMQTEEQASQLNNNITLGDIVSPPKKQLHPTIFNESPNGDYADDEDSRIDNGLQYNREPTDNNFDVSSDSDSEDNDPRICSLKTNKLSNYQVPKGYQNIEKHNKTNQNSSTISEREREKEKLDESYRKHVGIHENKHGYPPKSSSSRHRHDYSNRQKAMSSYDENDGLPSQSSHYYEGKLDEYLKSQERSSQDLRSVQSRNMHEMNSSDSHYAEELRRLKVPSIRLFEQNQVGHNSSNRTRIINDSRGSEQHSHQENKSILRNKDQNIQRKEKQNLKQDNHTEKDLQKDTKKAPSYPKKNKGETSKKERMSYQEKDVSNIENQNVNLQNQSLVERNKKSRSISARKENTGGVKTRSLSKDRRGTSKAEKKILARIHAETRVENERIALAKEMLRRYKLGTIDQGDLIKLLEHQLAASPEFFEGLKELVHK